MEVRRLVSFERPGPPMNLTAVQLFLIAEGGIGNGTTKSSSGRAMTSTVPEDEWAVFMGEFTRGNRGAHGEIEIYGSEGSACNRSRG